MQYAPEPNDDEIGTREDDIVADPLADRTLDLWNRTARTNIQRSSALCPLTLFVHGLRTRQAIISPSFLCACLMLLCAKGHVVRETQLQRILAQVRGSVVECPLVRPWCSVTRIGTYVIS